jgi:hypothetical protein
VLELWLTVVEDEVVVTEVEVLELTVWLVLELRLVVVEDEVVVTDVEVEDVEVELLVVVVLVLVVAAAAAFTTKLGTTGLYSSQRVAGS